MKNLKKSASNLIICILEILVGILLLIDPVRFTESIIITVGVVLIVIGVFYVLRYLHQDIEVAIISQTLAKGLVSIAAGAFCTFQANWFINTFPMITMLYGVVVLMFGLVKVQWTADMLRMKLAKWYLPAVSAVISIVCGAIILSDPFVSTEILCIFTGVSLIVEAVMDILVLCLGGLKEAMEKKEEKKEGKKEEKKEEKK